MAKIVDIATEIQARVDALLLENSNLINKTRDQELTIAMLKADNDSLRSYVQKLRSERDQFLRVANAIVTSCGDAKKIFNDALSAAHASIGNFKPEEPVALTEDDEARLKSVADGLKRINPDVKMDTPTPRVRQLPPNFLKRIETEMATR